MQRISEFSGIKLEMGYKEHYTPYVQATYNQVTSIFSLDTGEMIDVLNGEFDDFPYEQRNLVTAWIIIHKRELIENWKKSVENPTSSLQWIKPLQ